MTYNFQPMSEEELSAISLAPDGNYEFEVIKSTRKMSKAGNPMAELQLRYSDKTGIGHTIFDYLVFSTVPLNIKKVKRFCDTVGLQEEYKTGRIPEDLVGYRGIFKIATEINRVIPIDKLNGKPVGSTYPDKNIVEEYIKSEYSKPVQKAVNADPFINDEIPF